MKRFSAIAVLCILPMGCQSTGSEDRSTLEIGVKKETPNARIVLINEHPFDLEARLENPNGIKLAEMLAYLASNDTNVIDTNYDETKSLVTVIRGPLQAREDVVLKFRRKADRNRANNYEIKNEIPHDVRTDPAIIVNAYRIAFPAEVRARALVDGDVIAEKEFQADGPWRDRVSGWNLKNGDTRLTAAELRNLLVGKTIRIDVGGTASYSPDGRYERNRDGAIRTGTYEIREDELICTHLRSDRERCYAIVRDRKDHLVIINDGSIRYRMMLAG